MYHDFYQFKESPFNVTTDPDFFFSSKHHTEAVSNLMYGIEQRKGILVVTGEIGTGKTTLCRTLLRQINKNTKFALLLNPKFSDFQLLQIIVNDLGIPTKENTRYGIVSALNEFLLREANQRNNVVVLVDEAQNLSVSQLEQIRLLSNFETEKEKLLQIILLGQPELYVKLHLPSLRQLRQRIAVHYNLQPLAKEDVKHYIQHRLATATRDNASKVSFSDQAIESIFRHTQGTPRTINILCDRALLAGFVAETRFIDDNIIENCAREVLNW
ncbi:MAG: AAA family ATPase [Gammaproteobacteria bacterium]|nr:AAA family ATPase [Gammaproteobacteria bacterium]